MGVSGAGLYDDDIAADVRAAYRELIGDGLSGPAATDRVLADFADALGDPADRTVVWLALADTQWRLGRLEGRVRQRAEAIVADGSDAIRFVASPRLMGRRLAVLDELRSRLASAQPKPRRVRAPFRSPSPVAVGDVFSYELPDGRLAWLRAVDVSGDDRDGYPTVEVLAVGDGDGAPDPARAPSLPALDAPAGPRPDLVSLVRDRGDPDPRERIRVIARGVRSTRRGTVPATMVRWIELPEILERYFGR